MAAAKYRAYRLLRGGLGCFLNNKHNSRDLWNTLLHTPGIVFFLSPNVGVSHKIRQAGA